MTKLAVGKRYRLSYWDDGEYVEVLHIGKKCFMGRDSDGDEYTWDIEDDWIPC